MTVYRVSASPNLFRLLQFLNMSFIREDALAESFIPKPLRCTDVDRIPHHRNPRGLAPRSSQDPVLCRNSPCKEYEAKRRNQKKGSNLPFHRQDLLSSFFCKKRRRPSLFHGLALMLIIPFLLFFLVLFPAEQYFLLQAVSLLSCTYIRICILLQRIRP